MENKRIGKKLSLMLLDTLINGFVKKNINELELKTISNALKRLENPHRGDGLLSLLTSS